MSRELEPHAEKIREVLNNYTEEEIERALHAQLKQRFELFFSGVQECISAFPVRPASPPVMWQEGSTRLLNYSENKHPQQPVVLVVPSLINRSYILDLTEKQSLMRYLAGKNIHPLLIDWGEPAEGELTFTLDHYIERLEKVIQKTVNRYQQPVILVGYCMGGLMALASAQRKKEQVRGLILLATPWNFHDEAFARIRLDARTYEMTEALISAIPKIPASFIQVLFTWLHSSSIQKKFMQFGKSALTAEEKEEFIQLEQWINDGISMTTAVGKQCLLEWMQHNTLHKGEWNVRGSIINPATIAMPVLVALAKNDNIVPHGSSHPLVTILPGVSVIEPNTGHVGLMASKKAKQELWEPMVKWIKQISEKI